MKDNEILELANKIVELKNVLENAEYDVEKIEDSKKDLLSNKAVCCLNVDSIMYHSFDVPAEIGLKLLDFLLIEKEAKLKEAKEHYDSFLKMNNLDKE